MKLWKKCPLLVLIVVSGLLLEMIGLANGNGVYADYRPDGPETPAMAAVFTAAKDGVFPWSNLPVKKENSRKVAQKTAVRGYSPERETIKRKVQMAANRAEL